MIIVPMTLAITDVSVPMKVDPVINEVPVGIGVKYDVPYDTYTGEYEFTPTDKVGP